MTSFKDSFSGGEAKCGPFVSELRNPNAPLMLKKAGYDFFILDNEHGAYSPETISAMVCGARLAGLPVIVRIPDLRREHVLKALDAGANGIMAPAIETAQQA